MALFLAGTFGDRRITNHLDKINPLARRLKRLVIWPWRVWCWRILGLRKYPSLWRRINIACVISYRIIHHHTCTIFGHPGLLFCAFYPAQIRLRFSCFLGFI